MTNPSDGGFFHHAATELLRRPVTVYETKALTVPPGVVSGRVRVESGPPSVITVQWDPAPAVQWGGTRLERYVDWVYSAPTLNRTLIRGMVPMYLIIGLIVGCLAAIIARYGT